MLQFPLRCREDLIELCLRSNLPFKLSMRFKISHNLVTRYLRFLKLRKSSFQNLRLTMIVPLNTQSTPPQFMKLPDKRNRSSKLLTDLRLRMVLRYLTQPSNQYMSPLLTTNLTTSQLVKQLRMSTLKNPSWLKRLKEINLSHLPKSNQLSKV